MLLRELLMWKLNNMSWNYRVVRKRTYHGKCLNENVQFAIYETYYNKDGVPTAITTDYMSPYGETLEELKNDFSYMVAALNKPVLNWEAFKNKEIPEDKPIKPQYLDESTNTIK